MNKYNSQNDHDESFESLVDLFTLLSITLIVASLIFGIYKTQTNQAENNLTEVELSTISSGSKSTYQTNIPDNEIILVLSVLNNTKILTVINNKDSKTVIKLPNDRSKLFLTLDNSISNLLEKNHFTLVLSKQGAVVPYAHFTMIQEWFTGKGLDSLSTAFWNE